MIRHLQREFEPQRLLPSVIAGLTSGVSSVTWAISLGVLIFSGELAPYQSIGIGMGLFTNVIVGLGIGFISSHAPVLAAVDDAPTIILATVIASTAAKIMTGGADRDLLLTLLAEIAIIVILTGAIAWSLGQLQLGKFVRFIPYPVIGGFLAGTGWLLVQGGFSVILDLPLQSQLAALLQPNLLPLWLSGVVLAITLVILTRRYSHWSIFPGCILVALSLFFIGLELTHTSLATATKQGWLLSSLPQGKLWQPINLLNTATQANWFIILQNLPGALPVVLLSIISLLLCSSAIEIGVRGEINLDRELKAFGVSHVLSGLGGGLIGFHDVSDSLLAHKVGAKGRIACVIAALISGIALTVGSAFVSLFPKPLMGGLLIFLGIELLIEWVYESRLKLSRTDYFNVLVILAIIAAIGFLEGVIYGLGVAVILFVINYSRIGAAKYALSGATYRSNVQRSQNQQQILRERGEQIYILELQGLLFFGTANQLLEQIRQRLRDLNLIPLHFVVLNFHLVNGLDSSAVFSFVKLKQLAEKQQFTLVFTALSQTTKRLLRQGEVLDDADSLCQVFPDLDRGVEWCENQLLQTDASQLAAMRSLDEPLEPQFDNFVQQLMQYLKPLELQIGEYLFHQGDPFDGLYFVESGRVSVVLKLPNGQTHRLRSYTGGNIIGEMGLYRQTPRTASVVADQPSFLYFLSNDAFEEIETKELLLAASFHKFIVNLLAERLNHREQELKNLLQ